MKMRHLVLLLVCWASVAVTTSGQSGSAQEALEAARKTAVVDGNLAAAIEQYQAIVKKYAKSDRPVAAQALLRMAECYEKQDKAEAQRVYERVIREYADQASAAAEASSRVASLKPAGSPRVPLERLAVTLAPSDDPIGPVSRDGRYLMVVEQGASVRGLVHDLLTRSRRLIAQSTADEPYFWPTSAAFSPNGKHLAYVAKFERVRGQSIWQVRIVDLSVAGVPAPRVIAEATTVFGCASIPYRLFDWTPDGQWIAFRGRVNDDTQRLALMSVADGSIRELKTMPGRSAPLAGFLSPDGRFLAAEVVERQGAAGAAPTCESVTRNISIFAVEDGRETTVVDFPGDDRLMGWAPAGNGVLFTSARSGDSSLWMQRLADGRHDTEAAIVRTGYSPSRSLGMTLSGSLYSVADIGAGFRIKEAELDFSTGTFRSPPKDMPLSFVESNRIPRWSPDAKWLAYVSDRSGADRVIVLRSTDTAVSRDLPAPADLGIQNWAWMPDSRALVALGRPGPDGAAGLSRIDIANGVVSALAPRSISLPEWSLDGRTMFYDRQGATLSATDRTRIALDLITGAEREIGPPGTRPSQDGTKVYLAASDGGQQRLIERDLRSGVDRVLAQVEGLSEWHLTSDSTTIVAVLMDPKTRENVLVAYRLVDASPRVLLRERAPGRLMVMLQESRSRSLLVGRRLSPGDESYLWVPLDDRSPRQLVELSAFDRVLRFDLHPDGQRLAVGVTNLAQTGDQVRVLENMFPAIKGR